MKIKLLKLIISLFFLIIFLVTSLLLFDLTKYDPSYINRNSLTFSINNLNSKKAKLFFSLYVDLKQTITSKFNKNYQNHWNAEDKTLRESLPEKKVILAKQNNFMPATLIKDLEVSLDNWPRSHGGYTSKRFSNLDIINKSNVKKLELAWIYNSKDGRKGIQANPVAFNGLVYLPTPGNHIVALDGITGKEVWKYKVKKGYHAAKRGLFIFEDKKNNITKLYFTNDDQLIVLNAKNGKTIDTFGKNGVIKIGSSPIPPVIIDNKLVIVTSRPSIEVYDAESGKIFWKYYLRKINKKNFGEVDFKGGNPWGGISADIKHGLLYLTTGNPKPNFVGVTRPGKNLYANSVIAFDVRNKKLLWHFQETCHDLWNLDIPSTPILTSIEKNGLRINVVVVVTKLGNTLILDRYTGEPIFDYVMKRAPVSKIPGEKTCPYQPSLKLPEPFSKNVFTTDDVTNLSVSSNTYINSIINNSNFGFFATHEIGKDTIEYNQQGGAQWTGASINPFKNIMYVSASNIPWKVGVRAIKGKKNKIRLFDKIEEPLRDLEGYPGVKPPWGTLTALNLNTGKIKWQVPLGYYEALKEKGIISGTENFGGATATNGGLVFVAGTLDKLIRAFDDDTGKELWSYKLPYIGSAPPSSYKINDEQYIVIPASGGITLKNYYKDLVEQGDAIVAFKIKK